MFRILVLSMFLVFCACNNGGEPTAQQGSAASEKAGEGASGGVPPDEQMVTCLNRFREKKYDEAITVCNQALRSNPGDPQILKAIELSEEALNGGGT